MVGSENYWNAPAEKGIAVTPSDSANLALPIGVSGATSYSATKRVYVGGAGTLKVTLDGQKDSQAITFSAVPAGTTLAIQAKKIWATGTSATLILALY